MNCQLTLRERVVLCLVCFFVALNIQIALNFYQSGVVLRQLDSQMGNFGAISHFQQELAHITKTLDEYRWEYSDTNDLVMELNATFTTADSWLHIIDGDIDSVGEEQYLLYNAICTSYDNYTGLVGRMERYISYGSVASAASLYYDKVVPCGSYLSQYTQQLLNTAIAEAQEDYAIVSALSNKVKWIQLFIGILCLALGFLMSFSVIQLISPIQKLIESAQIIANNNLSIPDVPLPHQKEMAQLTDTFNQMKRSMALQVKTLREKNKIERELHVEKTRALELRNRMEHSRLQQLRSQIDPHFLFNTLNVILQTAKEEKGVRTQELIIALSHLLRYSLMSNDEQVSLSREIKIANEYYAIYRIRFGRRIQMRWRISDSLDITETMIPSFIIQPIIENAFKHGVSPKEEGGMVRIRISPLRQKDLLYINVCDNGIGLEPKQLAELQNALSNPHEQWEHIGLYNVSERLRLLDERCMVRVRSRPMKGTSVSLLIPLLERKENLDNDSIVDC